MLATNRPTTSEQSTSPAAISTAAQRLASSLLDRIEIEIERQNSGHLSTFQRLQKRTIESLFVPAFGREVAK